MCRAERLLRVALSDALPLLLDNGYYNTQEVTWAQQNATYRAAIASAGLHDPCEFFYGPEPTARELGWNLWASEDFSRDVTSWENSQNYWGKALSQVRRGCWAGSEAGDALSVVHSLFLESITSS